MRKFQRAEEPAFLAAKWEAWGLEWEQRRAANPAAQFHWHQIAGEPVNRRLLPILKEQTQDHCSFCDAYPVSPPGIDTIEHFRPKAQYPREAYRWGNLYLCCPYCQQKAADFDEAALQPDAAGFEFDRYFRWDYTLGTIEVNELASADDQHRAAVTIMLYHLNDGHPSWRKREALRHAKPGAAPEPLDSLPYRHYLEGPGFQAA